MKQNWTEHQKTEENGTLQKGLNDITHALKLTYIFSQQVFNLLQTTSCLLQTYSILKLCLTWFIDTKSTWWRSEWGNKTTKQRTVFILSSPLNTHYPSTELLTHCFHAFNLRPPEFSINQNRRVNSVLSAKKGGDWMGGILAPPPPPFFQNNQRHTHDTFINLQKQQCSFFRHFFFFPLIIIFFKQESACYHPIISYFVYRW